MNEQILDDDFGNGVGDGLDKETIVKINSIKVYSNIRIKATLQLEKDAIELMNLGVSGREISLINELKEIPFTK